MGIPQLSTAEQEYFKSGGTIVADSLKEGLPAAPVTPIKGHNEADVSHETQPVVETKPAEIKPVEVKPTVETEEQKAAAKAEHEKRRKEAVEELGLVPLEALQEARNEGKATKQELAALKQRLEQLEPVLKELPKAQVPTGEQNPYDPNVQPQEHKAYQEWLDTKSSVAEVKKWKEQQEQTAQANQQTQQLLGWNTAQETAYKATNPAYDEAIKFAETARHAELKAIAPWMEDAAIANVVQQDRAQLIMLAAQRTMQGIPTNPAELAFNYAKSKGFIQKPAENKPDPAVAAMQKIAAGQAAAGGLNGGSAPKGEMTLEELARMPTKTPEQRKAYDAAWNKLMRG